jgi:hypothetical protein
VSVGEGVPRPSPGPVPGGRGGEVERRERRRAVGARNYGNATWGRCGDAGLSVTPAMPTPKPGTAGGLLAIPDTSKAGSPAGCSRPAGSAAALAG